MNRKAVDVQDIDLDKLNARLRWGDKQRVIDRCGYCKQYVYAVLDPKNKRMNKEIIQAAIDVIEDGRKVEADENLAKELVA